MGRPFPGLASRDSKAGAKLTEAAYGDLRGQAARRLRGERPTRTLTLTDRVNEACLRLVGQRRIVVRAVIVS